MTEPLTAERLAEIVARVPPGEHPWRLEPRIVASGLDEQQHGFEIWTATADGDFVVAEVHDEWATDEPERDHADEGTIVTAIDATHDIHPDAKGVADFILHARDDVSCLLAEVKRLNAHLAEYVGWEPTVKEEYEHACDQLRRVGEIVRAFDVRPRLAVGQFVADLKRALEMD